MDNETNKSQDLALVLKLGAEVWYAISKWAKKNNKLNARQRKLAYRRSFRPFRTESSGDKYFILGRG